MTKPYISLTNARALVASPAPFNAKARQKFGGRLAKLHGLLSALPASQYDHSQFVREVDAKHPCGAVACAFGHAVVSKKFRGINAYIDWVGSEDEEGKTYNPDFYASNPGSSIASLQALLGEGEVFRATYPDYNQYDADERNDMSYPADEFFGPGAWTAIFSPWAYPNTSKPFKRTVLARIKNIALKCYGVNILMDLYILFGQRKVRYEGEYAPEALEVITEYGNDENPDFMIEAKEKAIQTGDFTNVQVLRIYVNDRALDNAMNPVSIHGAIRLDNKRLPEPAGILVVNGQALRAFTADQMHDYAGTEPVPPGAE